jgi:hypothetical protein
MTAKRILKPKWMSRECPGILWHALNRALAKLPDYQSVEGIPPEALLKDIFTLVEWYKTHRGMGNVETLAWVIEDIDDSECAPCELAGNMSVYYEGETD